MESDTSPPPPGEAANNGSSDVDPSVGGEAKQATPITNAILSQAVTSAISQLDTKRAFDMMLLNEQMSAMEAENKCLKEEASFLRESLAKQSQETSEMYHYFHGKMDAHVATIGTLESELAAARADTEQLKEQHALELENAHTEFQAELAKLNAEMANLRDELFQVHVFSTQKKQMEEQLRELQAELDAKVKQFAEEKNALELKGIFEKDRLKKEMLVHMKDTKEALLQRTDEQLNTTTKRTMMENDHFMEELSFQSKETEKLLMRYRQVEEEVQRLRVTNKVLEENELVMAKKNHYYQKILGQLKKQGKEPERQTLDVGAEDAAVAQVDSKELLAARDEADRLKAKIGDLEESLKHAHQWVQAFQHEKQFVVAQQDEIIQFLCRALSDAAMDLAVKHQSRRNRELFDGDTPASTQALTIHDAARATVTMEELVTRIAPISLDELSASETRDVLRFLLEKMKTYQEQVAMIYRGQSVSPASPLGSKPHEGNRELLSKQLGVELPPIAQPHVQIVSPLKVKRRIQPHAPASLNAPRPPPANQDFSSQQVRAKLNPEAVTSPNRPNPEPMTSPNRLLSMATSHFNFLQPTPSPVKKPSAHKLPLSPTKLAPRVAPRRESLTDPSSALDEPSLAVGGTQPSAWSTDSLPPFDPTGVSDSTSPATDSHQGPPKNASASRRKT